MAQEEEDYYDDDEFDTSNPNSPVSPRHTAHGTRHTPLHALAATMRLSSLRLSSIYSQCHYL